MPNTSSAINTHGVTPYEVMLQPWPKREAFAGLGLSKEEKMRISERNRERRNKVLSRKLAVCPQFSVTMSPCWVSKLSLPGGRIPFKVSLKYEGMPAGQSQAQRVVLREPALFSPRSMAWGHFRIFTDPDLEHALDFNPPMPLMRRPRGADGRFLERPPFPLSADAGWLEMGPGDEISKELVLDPACSPAWQRSLEPGKTYYLRYHPYGVHLLCKAEIASSGWRFGSLAVSNRPNGRTLDADRAQEYVGRECDPKQDRLYIGIPLPPSGSAIEFRIISASGE